MRVIWKLLSGTIHEFSRDNAMRLAAALAFYSALSLAPALVVTFTVIGMISEDPQTREEFVLKIEEWMGADASAAIRAILAAANQPRGQTLATIISIATLLFSGSAVFAEIQESMNIVWNIPPQSGRFVWRYVRKRLLGLFLMLIMGLMVLLSVLSTWVLNIIIVYMQDWVPADGRTVRAVNYIISLLLFTGLFALMFRLLPDVKLRWSDVLPGAALTTFLFVTGKELLGLYIGRTSTRSAYGAAGSLVVLLLWVYYSSIILFFGAEFTQVYHQWRSGGPPPSKVKPPHRRRAAAVETGSEPVMAEAAPHTEAPAPGTKRA